MGARNSRSRELFAYEPSQDINSAPMNLCFVSSVYISFDTFMTDITVT
jgi:hypothetical protein